MHLINYLDIAIIVIFLIITIMGCIVGFTGKILSIIGWGLAGTGTFYLYPYGKPIAHQCIENPLIADVTAGGVIFLILLVFFLIVAKMAANVVKKSPLSFLDRSLGMFLGMFLGISFLSLMTLSLDFLIPQSQFPDIVKQSKLYPFLKITADYLERRIPGVVKKKIEEVGGEVHQQTQEIAQKATQEIVEEEQIEGEKDMYQVIKEFAD